MASKFWTVSILFLFFYKADCSTVLERGYEYFVNFGKNVAPSFMSILECMNDQDVWGCAKEKVGRILDGWDDEVDKQRRMWQKAADAEVAAQGRSLNEMPSQIGREVEESLQSVVNFLDFRMSRSLGKKHHSDGIDSITITTGGGEKKKMKKKKPKPPKIHLLHPLMLKMQKKQEKGRESRVQSWVIGDSTLSNSGDSAIDLKKLDEDITNSDVDVTNSNTDVTKLDTDMISEDETSTDVDTEIAEADEDYDSQLDANGDLSVNEVAGRGIFDDLWSIGGEALDDLAEHALKNDNKENGIIDKSSLPEQRGKKKKKKKAILKLLILGAVLKAKIGTLLQILSFKLQVKFFIIALIGLGINLARLWIDVKNKHNHQPQKVIYYEHAQHQHHYDHEDDHDSGWGPWSRSIMPEDSDVAADVPNTPYRAHERHVLNNPLLSKF